MTQTLTKETVKRQDIDLTETLDIREFDGPLDLLHHLMERHRYNWYDIPIAEITGQYLAYMKKMEELDMDLASDFLVMAAT